MALNKSQVLQLLAQIQPELLNETVMNTNTSERVFAKLFLCCMHPWVFRRIHSLSAGFDIYVGVWNAVQGNDDFVLLF